MQKVPFSPYFICVHVSSYFRRKEIKCEGKLRIRSSRDSYDGEILSLKTISRNKGANSFKFLSFFTLEHFNVHICHGHVNKLHIVDSTFNKISADTFSCQISRFSRQKSNKIYKFETSTEGGVIDKPLTSDCVLRISFNLCTYFRSFLFSLLPHGNAAAAAWKSIKKFIKFCIYGIGRQTREQKVDFLDIKHKQCCFMSLSHSAFDGRFQINF